MEQVSSSFTPTLLSPLFKNFHQYTYLIFSFTDFFPQYAEEIPSGKTCKALSECAKNLNIFVVGGSIPESDGGKLYNTTTVWNQQGELVAKHRKVRTYHRMN